MDKPPKFDQNDYVEFDLEVDRTPGDTIRILRQISEWSQKELEAQTGIPQTTISAIENNRQNLGVERTKVFAKVFNVHPSVILFPNWKSDAA
jgi:transcriptional regulator with XRE-family HTH domain